MRLSLIALVICATAGAASAYPQFQLSTGADTCRTCHYSAGGGGLINDYGRDEVSGLSMFERGGDGRFLHGAWDPPASFALGADLRLAAGVRADPIDVDGSGDSLLGPVAADAFAFPMQGDVYLRPKVRAVSFHMTLGARGAARSPRPLVQRLASREHYVQYEPSRARWYARAGRFFPVYGLRTQDHTAYVRRHLQMYLLEEPYGAAWGTYRDAWELHVSAFVKSPRSFLGQASDDGVAAYWEHRDEDATTAFGAQTKLTVSATDRRAWAGAVYKRWMEESRLMVLGELDLGVQDFPAPPSTSAALAPAPRAQLVGYLGATYFARQGLLIGGAVQAYDPDLALEATSRAAAEVNVQWFPIPHLELHLLTRLEAVGLDVDDTQALTLLQLHYFL